jgi:hypothetical protein
MGLQYVRPAHVGARLPDHFPEAPVEGLPPSRRLLRIEREALALGIVLAFAGAIAAGYALDGARGVIVGLTVFAFYFLLGWWPYFAAARCRRRAHEEDA